MQKTIELTEAEKFQMEQMIQQLGNMLYFLYNEEEKAKVHSMMLHLTDAMFDKYYEV